MAVLVCISSFQRRSASSLSAKEMVLTFLDGLSNLIMAMPESVIWTFWKNWYFRSGVGVNASFVGNGDGDDSTAAVENQEIAPFKLEEGC